MRIVRVLFLGIVFNSLFAPAQAADLTIVVSGVHNNVGSILAILYDSKDTYMNADLAKKRLRASAAQGDVTFVIHDLPHGTYALSSFHDEKGTGHLETNSFGVPIEGYGFSNDAQGTMGPPSFSKASFLFDGKSDKTISFSLNY